MANCANCKKRLGCGCQRKKASDGTSCCVTCLAKYELSLKTKK